MADKLSDIVVFRNPDGSPFSMDPRWQDSRVKEAWIKKYGMEPSETTDPETEEPEPVVEDDDEEEAPYSEWTNDELRAELNNRQLSLDGKKADLIARLEKSDEESGE